MGTILEWVQQIYMDTNFWVHPNQLPESWYLCIPAILSQFLVAELLYDKILMHIAPGSGHGHMGVYTSGSTMDESIMV
jgi:hypothetical protein